jgi:hypothetical protein
MNGSDPSCWAYPDMLEVGCAHGPGGDHDPGLTAAETRSHFGAWAIVSSPLTLSMDVNNDTVMDAVWPVVANKEAIAVNQAWAGHSGSPFKTAGEIAAASSSSSKVELKFRSPRGPAEVGVALEGATKKTTTTSESGSESEAVEVSFSVPAWQYFYKPLGAGSVAVLLMNHLPSGTADLQLALADVPGLDVICGSSGSGGCMVRDVWARSDVGVFAYNATYTAAGLEPHDAAFITISAAQ